MNSSDQFIGSGIFWFLVVSAVFLNVIIGASVAEAAQRKNRSWAAFFWLSIFIGWPWTALGVALLPFDDRDPKKPKYWENLDDEDSLDEN